MKLFAAAVVFCALLLVPLSARVDLLLVPPTGPIQSSPGHELTLYVNNPTNEDDAVLRLPTSLTAVFATPTTRGVVRLNVVRQNAVRGAEVTQDKDIVVITLKQMSSQIVTLRLTDALPPTDGFVSLRLTNPESNTIMFRLTPDPAAATAKTPPPAVAYTAAPVEPDKQVKNNSGDIDLRSDVEGVRRHISGYDPIYFAVGARDRINARFQFSFKYRLLEAQAEPEIIRDLYFAYTQTSIWDLESFSKPFYDSSYKPTAFFLREKFHETGFWSHIGLQIGAQHESNGKGGGSSPAVSGLISPTTSVKHPLDTRSLNTLYIAPKLRWSSPETGWFAEVSARAIAYFQIDENPDLPSYRGHVELLFRGGHDRGGQLTMLFRGSPRRGRGSADFNFTWPMTRMPLPRLLLPTDILQAGGGYFLIQYFNGYGESLLDYDVRRKDQLRIGLEIVR